MVPSVFRILKYLTHFGPVGGEIGAPGEEATTFFNGGARPIVWGLHFLFVADSLGFENLQYFLR